MCDLGHARSLRVVVPSGAEATVLATTPAGTTPLAATETSLGALGVRRAFDVPANAVTVDVVVRDGRFRLAIRPSSEPGWATEAKARRSKGDMAGASALAREHASDPDERARAAAADLLARLALADGRADDAATLFREAIAMHRAAGRSSDAVDDSFALAFALSQRSRRYDEARKVLADARAELPVYPEGAAREPYYRGVLAAETGDRRAAVALLRDAEARAHLLGMTRLERDARSALALEMQALGRLRPAMELLQLLVAEHDLSPCELALANNNLGWAALLVDEAEGTRAFDARGPLERAARAEGCKDAYLASFALGNLARLALDDGDPQASARLLAEAEGVVKEPRQTERIGWLVLQGRIRLARGEANAAIAKFDEARALARAAVLLDAQWAASLFRSEAQLRAGRIDEAIADLVDAESCVDRAMLQVPLGEGRGGFVAERTRSAVALVDALSRRGRVREAAAVGKHSRARVLASVARAIRIENLGPEARGRWERAVRDYRVERDAIDRDAADDWKLAANELASVVARRRGKERDLRAALEQAMSVLSPDPWLRTGIAEDRGRAKGELDIVIHPTAQGWSAFVIDETAASTTVLPAPDADPAAIARALLDPIAPRLASATTVHVHPFGRYRDVDVHALLVGGKALGVQVPIDYPAGLGPRSSNGSARDSSLVVGDPTSDLPWAFDEAIEVHRSLSARGRSVLFTRADATARNVVPAIAGATMFHYAGHGVFAGSEGFESALPLADGGRLAIGDVLALAGAPQRVVLTGCDAAKTQGAAEGLGLAQAFVVAGSSEVLAPTRPVADAAARSLSAVLYEPAMVGAPLADRLRSAVRAGGHPDWTAFRVLTR